MRAPMLPKKRKIHFWLLKLSIVVKQNLYRFASIPSSRLEDSTAGCIDNLVSSIWKKLMKISSNFEVK